MSWHHHVVPLQWRYDGHDVVSNQQPHKCLLNRLFRRKSKKTSKLSVTGFCAENSPVIAEFPAQRASYAANVSIWWCHHAYEKPIMSTCHHELTGSMHKNRSTFIMTTWLLQPLSLITCSCTFIVDTWFLIAVTSVALVNINSAEASLGYALQKSAFDNSALSTLYQHLTPLWTPDAEIVNYQNVAQKVLIWAIIENLRV